MIIRGFLINYNGKHRHHDLKIRLFYYFTIAFPAKFMLTLNHDLKQYVVEILTKLEYFKSVHHFVKCQCISRD